MNFKNIGNIFTSKSLGTEPSSYRKKNLPGRGLTKFENHWFRKGKLRTRLHHINNEVIKKELKM
jgi:hypothetical protein